MSLLSYVVAIKCGALKGKIDERNKEFYDYLFLDHRPPNTSKFCSTPCAQTTGLHGELCGISPTNFILSTEATYIAVMKQIMQDLNS